MLIEADKRGPACAVPLTCSVQLMDGEIGSYCDAVLNDEIATSAAC